MSNYLDNLPKLATGNNYFAELVKAVAKIKRLELAITKLKKKTDKLTDAKPVDCIAEREKHKYIEFMLKCDLGLSNVQIAAYCGCNANTVTVIKSEMK